MLLVAMLSRLNSAAEVSILPTGLGNHYTSNNKHLIPPGRRKFPYNHSISSESDACMGDPNAPEANMSYREHQEYFGPDVLVIIGLVLASLGAILTLISFYCHFKHPAIQATMAGIGPSLVGIGMLFCILRLFFCTFCISKTCCECIGDGLKFIIIRSPCCKCFQKPKKKIHPLHIKDIHAAKLLANGKITSNKLAKNGIANNNNSIARLVPPGSAALDLEMMPYPFKMEPITESEEQRNQSSRSREIDRNCCPEIRVGSADVNNLKDLLNHEIDLMDEMKSEASESPISLHKNVNELVLKTKNRY